MSCVPCPSERATAKGMWLLGPDGELLERYASERDAQRAADDFNATGRATGAKAALRVRSPSQRSPR